MHGEALVRLKRDRVPGWFEATIGAGAKTRSISSVSPAARARPGKGVGYVVAVGWQELEIAGIVQGGASPTSTASVTRRDGGAMEVEIARA